MKLPGSKPSTSRAQPLGHSVPPIKTAVRTRGGSSEVIAGIESVDDWLDVPSIPDQLADPDHWKSAGVEAKIFDLSNAAELKAYNELLSEVDKPNSNKFLTENRREVFPALGTWKALVLVQTVKYRRLIVKKETKP